MEDKLKQYEVLEWASLFLKEYNREQRVSELLLQHYLQVSRASFLANMREVMEPHIVKIYKEAIREHALTGIPIQHLIGSEEFYGRLFHVSKDVLIPRMETEELVEKVIHEAEKITDSSYTIVDLGTGSGIIAITLALELPEAKVYATDISKKALQIAKKNASELHAPVTFLEGDFLQPCIDNKILPQIIVSNPPYISRNEEETLSDTVKNFDPSLALFADDEGLAAYETIVKQIEMFDKRPEKLFFEIGHTQGEQITDLIQKYFLDAKVSLFQDINKNDRIICAQLKE